MKKHEKLFLGQMEESILRSTDPIKVNATAKPEITINGQRGLWLNRHEAEQWQGDLPIDRYKISTNVSPEVIKKRVNTIVEYIRQILVRDLKPPTPPVPGEILIIQEPDIPTRQASSPPEPLEPLVIRQTPPKAPLQVNPKIIKIPGKRLEPPARQVITERLPVYPAPPQTVIIDKWQPYKRQKRRVIFNRETSKVRIFIHTKKIRISRISYYP